MGRITYQDATGARISSKTFNSLASRYRIEGNKVVIGTGTLVAYKNVPKLEERDLVALSGKY